MTIPATTLTVSSTGLTATAGSTQNLVTLGPDEAARSHLVAFEGDTTYVTRRTIRFQNKPPTPQASSPDGFTKARRLITVNFPITLASGEVTVDQIRVEFPISVEASTAVILERRRLLAQIIYKSTLDDFFNMGSIA